jgi:hypothetical protein
MTHGHSCEASGRLWSNRPRTATANGSRSWARLLYLCLLSSIALTGCLRPYKTSVFDPPTAQFRGITSEWHGKSGGDIRVLFVHGICTHDELHWITDGWDQVIKGYFPSATKTVTTETPVGQVQIIDHEYQIGQNKISGRYLIWSALTATDKAKLIYDDRPTDNSLGQFTWKRAKINGELKATLLNDCLSDAVIYAGVRGSDIQTAMQNAICAALDGTTSNDTCTFPPTYGHGNRRIVIVTESLGSRMVFDAISALKIEAQRKVDSKADSAALDAFEEAVAPISQIYMLANQLPILALARPALVQAASTTDPSNSKTPAMATALSVLHDARVHHQGRNKDEPQPPKLSLVAFTDPNDLLSYRLQTNDPAVLGADTRVVNVITSNADTYFGEVENPLSAHTTYNQNPDALRVLFGGSTEEKP